MRPVSAPSVGRLTQGIRLFPEPTMKPSSAPIAERERLLKASVFQPMSRKKTKQKSGLGAGIIAFGAVFALYSALFHPHSIGGYVLACALSGLVGAVIRIMAQGLDRICQFQNLSAF